LTEFEWLGEDNQIGIDIWRKKYQRNDETFEQWLDRVSGGNHEVRELIKEKKFLFGGRILSNRGMDKYGKKITYSNCYVITPPEDNIESIYECATKLARTYSYGGGCGIDISKLSPRGAKINNSAEATTGSVSFMDLYNLTTDLIGQNGRRGAMMISLTCDHPDLEEFIDIKSDLSKITKANISIKITDEFMKAVKEERYFDLTFTRDETGETITKRVFAPDIWRKLCRMNWDYAEPGILFWDRIRDWNLLSEDEEFEYAGTNPCAEEPLPAGGSCLLGSLNLAEFVTPFGEFDYEEFKHAVMVAVTALNEVLDEGMPLHPLQEQRDSVRDWRQIGLGIFGLADMLIKMGIKYGSDRSLIICDKIGFNMANQAIRTSAMLASAGGPYPKYKHLPVVNSGFYCHNTDYTTSEVVNQYGLRNSQLMTIAPTGSLSTMLGVSGGIEPIFANYYERKTESLHGHDEYYKIYTPIVKKYMEEYDIDNVEDLPDFFVTARDINYKERIEMQATWQNHIDASISSTINLPNDISIEQVEDLYRYAWGRCLKGVTIFREGCQRTAVLSTDTEQKNDIPEYSGPVCLNRGIIIKANDTCVGKKRTLHTGCGTLHCEAFFEPTTGELREVYLNKGSTGGCNNFMVGLSRMISLAARGGVSIDDILDQLGSSGTCPSYAVRTGIRHDTSKGSSCPVAVGNALKEMYEEMQVEVGKREWLSETVLSNLFEPDTVPPMVVATNPVCPECGGNLVFEGGCNTCKDCGWSKCD